VFKINLNKELDYEVYLDFWDFSVAGANFAELIKKKHPSINQENYKKYIDDFYNNKKIELLKKQKEIEQKLGEKEEQFFVELEKIFNINFSKNIYQGYLSIFNCNPRWLDTKSFQIYWQKDLKQAVEVALHETLHFAFFEYLDKNFKEKIEGLDKNSGALWELSEIINIIILNLPQFKNILDLEEKLFYTSLKDKLDRVKIIWDENSNFNDFVDKTLGELVF